MGKKLINIEKSQIPVIRIKTKQVEQHKEIRQSIVTYGTRQNNIKNIYILVHTFRAITTAIINVLLIYVSTQKISPIYQG